MNAQRMRGPRLVLVVLMLIGVWGCAAKPFDPPQTGEIPKGPGIFSKGDDGVVVYDSNKGNANDHPRKHPDPPTPTGTDQTTIPSAAGDYEEFEAYRQFKAWKQSAEGTKAYEEFQQWRQWQQYRQWKRQQQ